MKSMATKLALAGALKQMLLKKPLSKITITDLTGLCGISRMTFYYHFKDIYDLLEWMCLQEARQAIAGDRGASWRLTFENLLKLLRDNQAGVMNIYRSMDQERIGRFLRPVVEGMILNVLEGQAADLPISDQSKHRIAVFYTYAFLGVVVEWIKQDMKTPPKEVVTVVSVILRGDFRHSLENMSKMEAQMRGKEL